MHRLFPKHPKKLLQVETEVHSNQHKKCYGTHEGEHSMMFPIFLITFSSSHAKWKTLVSFNLYSVEKKKLITIYDSVHSLLSVKAFPSTLVSLRDHFNVTYCSHNRIKRILML